MRTAVLAKRRAQSLADNHQAYVATMAKKRGLRLSTSENGPTSTNESVLNVRPIPVGLFETDPEKAEKLTLMVMGDTDHECGHHLFTDLSVPQRTKSDLEKSVWNALEDTYEERKMAIRYPGCEESLASSVAIAIELGHVRRGDQGPADALITFCDAWGRKFVLGQAVDPIFDSATGEMEKLVGNHGLCMLNGLLSQHLFSTESSEENLVLARRVLSLMQEIKDGKHQPSSPQPAPQPPQQQDQGQQQQGQGQGGDQQQQAGQGQADQNGQGQSSALGQDGQPDPANGDSTGAQPDASSSSDGAGGNGHGSDPGQDGQQQKAMTGAGSILDDQNVPQGPVVDRGGAVEQLVSEGESQGHGYTPESRAFRPKPDLTAGQPSLQEEQAVRSESQKLGRRIASSFLTATRVRSVAADEGRLDGRRLHLVPAGVTNVFRQKMKTDVPRPAVSLLIDSSGSMKGKELELAKAATICLGDTLSHMGVPFEILTFSNTKVSLVGGFGTSWRKVRPLVWGLKALGSTPTHHALWIGGHRILSRKEDRKLIFLVTDGNPDDAGGAITAARLVRNSGIELYGLGIRSSSMKCKMERIFGSQQYRDIPSAGDIARAVLETLQARTRR